MTIDMKAIHDSTHTLVMGVLNITEDSFSDGGLWLDPAKAKAHGEAMMKAGADIIDIGAESTRPGVKRVSEEDDVSEEDEQTRVLGAVDALISGRRGAVHRHNARLGSSNGTGTWSADHQRRVRRSAGPRSAHVVAEHAESLYIVQHWRGWLAGSAGNVPTPIRPCMSMAW